MDYLLHHLSSLTRIFSFRPVEFWRFRQVWRPKLLKNLISQRRKGPTKIVLYSLECLLQKRKNGTVCKVLLTSKHLEISSSKKNFTSVHLTPSWNGKELVWNCQCTQNFYFFCSFVWYFIRPASSSPCSPPWAFRTPSRPTSSSLRWGWKVTLLLSNLIHIPSSHSSTSDSDTFHRI